MLTLANIFSPGGALARRLPGFTYREAQQRMAELVWQALESGEHAAIEAGTGIGKTFAYLLPVLLAGRRAIISTGTRTLQDQLFARDLPMLGAVVGRPAEVALLKGRSNYLCWHRLETALNDGLRDAQTMAALRALSDWGHGSHSGDLTELEDLSEDHALRSVVTSTVDNCLGSHCAFFDRCFVLEARRRAQQAQVVIVNHHLLLADLALKEAGFGELLPGADAVIVDEAHQLPDIAQQFFGVSVSTRELELLAREVLAEARLTAIDAETRDELDATAGAVLRSVVETRIAAGSTIGRIPWIAAPPRLRDALPDCRQPLDALQEVLERIEEAGSEGLRNCLERCRNGALRLRSIAAVDPEEGLRWFDLATGAVTAHSTPLDIGTALAARIEAQSGAWIFTSATLAVGEDFTHFLQRIGIGTAATCVLPSPFDYANNARLYVPQGLPDPSDDSYVVSLMAAVWPLVQAIRGGAFLLFTSYRALHRAQEWIERQPTPGRILVQGRGPRSELLQEFRAAGNAILLGTGSFWQGVDVRGPALRLVVIDKLPFAVPSDPLVQARVEAIRRDGGDAFKQFQLPQAVLSLKQGVGRLIRDFDDRGLIVIGDPRLRTRSYGRVFLASLPSMPLLEELTEALEFATSLVEAPDDLPARAGMP
ncbi:MAG TPA: ATP-dependent DNA helicase [Gammaproteobacteria bacterium]|nr:ATP-dependent DNA helicase [Gammaproteobacteria bacterium]